MFFCAWSVLNRKRCFSPADIGYSRTVWFLNCTLLKQARYWDSNSLSVPPIDWQISICAFQVFAGCYFVLDSAIRILCLVMLCLAVSVLMFRQCVSSLQSWPFLKKAHDWEKNFFFYTAAHSRCLSLWPQFVALSIQKCCGRLNARSGKDSSCILDTALVAGKQVKALAEKGVPVIFSSSGVKMILFYF